MVGRRIASVSSLRSHNARKKKGSQQPDQPWDLHKERPDWSQLSLRLSLTSNSQERFEEVREETVCWVQSMTGSFPPLRIEDCVPILHTFDPWKVIVEEMYINGSYLLLWIAGHRWVSSYSI